MAIPPDILAAQAAGRIPDGISVSYLAQSRDHSAIVGIVFLVCLTGVLMALRLYARMFIVKKTGLDDALAILTMVCRKCLPCLETMPVETISNDHSTIDDLHPIRRTLHHPHQPRKWPPYRVHPICPLPSNGPRNRSPRLHCSHSLYHRPASMSTFRSGLLLPSYRTVQQASHCHHGSCTGTLGGLSSPTLTFDLPLQACDRSVAVCLAKRASHLQMSDMGLGVLCQFGRLARLRCDDVHHPCHPHQAAPRLCEKQDQAFASHVPRSLVSTSFSLIQSARLITTQRDHHLRHPRLARRRRPMGLGRQLGLQPNAMHRERRDSRNNNRPLRSSPQTRLRQHLLPSDGVYIQS